MVVQFIQFGPYICSSCNQATPGYSTRTRQMYSFENTHAYYSLKYDLSIFATSFYNQDNLKCGYV